MEPKFTWNEDKNEWLKQARGFGFEAIVEKAENGEIVADIAHPKPQYQHQKMLIVELEGYAVCVPYVLNGNEKFLKTAYLDRKWQRKIEQR